VPGCRGAVDSETFQRHRAARSAAAASAENSDSIAVTPRRARSTSETPYFGVPAGEAGASVEGATASRAAAPDSDLPAWALAIADELFRSALLYLELHGLLNEGELMSMVGGPRRARAFSRELDGWLATLPFGIEVSVVGGAKAYRKVACA
jgi:hypothetical protein